ncbi:MAG: hypothetical protein WCC58_05535 [Burkholderiales bacterium]
MIAISRTASIAPGKTGEAIEMAHKVAKYIKDKHGTTLEVFMPLGGNPARISWHARYESLAEWETLSAKLLGDKKYMDLLSKNKETFLPGSVRDEIWRSI